MGSVVAGRVSRLDGAPESAVYLTASLVLPDGETTAVMSGGPVSRGADMKGLIALPLGIKSEVRVHLRLAVPGRTLREATVTLKPDAVYSLASVFSGAQVPEPSQSPTPGVEISVDGDTAAITGIVSGDGDTVAVTGIVSGDGDTITIGA